MLTTTKGLTAAVLLVLAACAQPPGVSPAGPGATEPGAPYGLHVVSQRPEAIERQLVTLINQYRANEGRPAFRVYGPLRDIARAHAKDMLARNFVTETTPDGKTLASRLNDADIVVSQSSEVDARTGPYPHPALNLLINPRGGWFRSEDGVKLLSLGYTSIGVGVALDENQIYASVILTRP
jgi:uncharacterized protein YkwD